MTLDKLWLGSWPGLDHCMYRDQKFWNVSASRMQNDMKLPPELRRKWVLWLTQFKMFSLNVLITLIWNWMCFLLLFFFLSFSYKHAIDGLYRVFREGKSQQCSVCNVMSLKRCHHVWFLTPCPVLQRVWGDCSQEPPWPPAEERWSLWDRQVTELLNKLMILIRSLCFKYHC